MKKRGRISEQPNGIAEVVAHACVIAIHINDEYKRKMARVLKQHKFVECSRCNTYDSIVTECKLCGRFFCYDSTCTGGGFCSNNFRHDDIDDYYYVAICIDCEQKRCGDGNPATCRFCGDLMKLRVVKKNV